MTYTETVHLRLEGEGARAICGSYSLEGWLYQAGRVLLGGSGYSIPPLYVSLIEDGGKALELCRDCRGRLCPSCGSLEISGPSRSDPLHACADCGHTWDPAATLPGSTEGDRYGEDEPTDEEGPRL